VQKVLYAVGGLLLLLVVIGLALPREAVVRATTDVDAFPATVFALANDFERVALWTPRLVSDPNAHVVHSGPERGVGSAMTWDGPLVGTGTELITDSRPYRYIEYAINPAEPGSARSWLEFDGVGGGTQVSWTYETDYGFNLVARYFAPLLSGVVQRDLANGLSNLRDLAESMPRVDFSDLDIEEIVVAATEIAYLPATSRPEPGAISAAMGQAYFEILSFIDAHGLEEAGPPLSITRSFSGTKLFFDAAIPVDGPVDDVAPDDGSVRIGHTYGGPVVRVAHVGPYRTLGTTHRKIAACLAALGIERNGDAWESYVSDPTRVPEEELLTYVYYPVRP
jgi:effector-binding domain-containing protein/uncharacterized protein YndB with AHSA1/START domain